MADVNASAWMCVCSITRRTNVLSEESLMREWIRLVFATWSHVVFVWMHFNCELHVLQNGMIENESQLEMIMFWPQEYAQVELSASVLCGVLFLLLLWKLLVDCFPCENKRAASGCLEMVDSFAGVGWEKRFVLRKQRRKKLMSCIGQRCLCSIDENTKYLHFNWHVLVASFV